MEIKYTDRKYNVQDNSDVAHQDVEMYCNTNQLTELPFCGTHYKPHGAMGLSKHYHFHLDTKLVNVACAIRFIPFACVAFTSMIDKPWIYGIPSDKQDRYKPIINCTDWTVLGSFNNWNMIQLSQKSTPSEAFDEIHQVILDGISYDMASFV